LIDDARIDAIRGEKTMAGDADKQLEDIKRLLVLLLMKLGSPSEEIALALQVDSSAVRRLIPGRKVKKIVPE
jgi:hypothetical protein